MAVQGKSTCIICGEDFKKIADHYKTNKKHWRKALNRKQYCRGKKAATAIVIVDTSTRGGVKYRSMGTLCLQCGRFQEGVERTRIQIHAGDTVVLVELSSAMMEWLGERTLPPGTYYYTPPELGVEPPEDLVGVYTVVVPNPLRCKWSKHYDPLV